MMHARTTTLRRALFASVAALSLVAPAAMAQQFQVSVGFPPFGFIATTPPVYYEGRPHYYYSNRWYYRDGSAWRYYRQDPYYLRNYYGSHHLHGPQRYYYGRGYGQHYYYRR